MTAPIRLRPLPLALLALAATPATAQLPAFLGAQSQVNQTIASDQRAPAVALAPGGGGYVVWESYSSPGTDADGRSVQLQRLGAGGTLSGAQVQVNSVTAGEQKTPAVACDPVSGRVMVVWESPGATGADGFDLRARVFEANGTPVASDFVINTFTTGDQLFPAVAGAAEGFVVVWQSDDDTGAGTDNNIVARVYDAAGAALTGELQVNELLTGAQTNPAVAAAGDDFLAVWQSGTSAGTDTTTTSIQARWILGGFSASSFQVNDHPPVMDESEPAVAVAPDGSAVVIWTAFGSIGNDSSRYAIQARRYSAAGAAGAQFQVNGYTPDDQRFARVALDADGTFVATWQSYGSSGDDADEWSIQARGFAANDAPIAGDRQSNTFTTGNQLYPALAVDARGGMLLAWQSAGSPGDDQIGTSIQARRLSIRLLFADDFETGNRALWSLSVP
jgi:hypothetical protein